MFLKLPVRTALIFSTLLSFAACSNSDGGSSNATDPGAAKTSAQSFEGIWMADDILEYKKTKNEDIICDNIENSKYTGYQDNLRIDGLVIDANGSVFDFQILADNFRSAKPVWKVQADGSTSENVHLNSNCTGCEDIAGLRMSKIDDQTIANIWTLKKQEGGTSDSEVRYYRMTLEEINQIKAIFEKCP